MTLRRLMTLALGGYLMFTLGCGGDSGSATSSSSSSTPSSSSSASSTPASSDSSEPAADAPAAPVEVKEGWGTLKGKFVLDGTLPNPAALQVTKDQEFCGKHNLVDESVVVNAENKGIANVVVHLYIGRGDKAPEPHESYAEAASTPIVIDNDKCRFEPHVLFLQPNQTLLIKNSDPVGHNTKIDSVDNPAFNQTLPSGAEIEHTFVSMERRPAGVSCSIHPWMRGWLVIQDTPYAVISDANGEFEIPNLPAGTWTFQVWHETAGMISKANVGGKAETWRKGRFEVTIQGDETNDLGTLELAADLFKS